MKTDLISPEEREKAMIGLQTAIEATITHDMEDPYWETTPSGTGAYDGALEPILVAIIQGFKHGVMGVLQLMTPEEKLKYMNKMFEDE